MSDSESNDSTPVLTKADIKAQARQAKKARKAQQTGDDAAEEWERFEKQKKVTQKSRHHDDDDDDEHDARHGKKKAAKKVVAEEPKRAKRSKPSQPLPPFKFFEKENASKTHEALSAEWEAMPPEGKEKYKTLAQQDRVRYKQEMDEYRANQEVAEKSKSAKKGRSGW
jgi:hypothetical protein